jgi:TetR/AcrR family transcriptional repressor of mexJK operon
MPSRNTTQSTESRSELAAPAGGRSAHKRRAVLAAATEIFLRSGYLGASVDEIAAASHVSKQTIYKQFTSKEALFIEVVASLTNGASDAVHNDAPPPETGDEVAGYLRDYGLRQLRVVLNPRLLQLRRMVIGESSRFPELGKALYDSGPGRAITAIAGALEQLSHRGFLTIDDPAVAAAQFNWLVMGGPVNAAMFLGDEAAPDAEGLRRHTADAVRVFMAAYAAPSAQN